MNRDLRNFDNALIILFLLFQEYVACRLLLSTQKELVLRPTSSRDSLSSKDKDRDFRDDNVRDNHNKSI